MKPEKLKALLKRLGDEIVAARKAAAEGARAETESIAAARTARKNLKLARKELNAAKANEKRARAGARDAARALRKLQAREAKLLAKIPAPKPAKKKSEAKPRKAAR